MSVFVAVSVPLTAFVAFWWGSAGLAVDERAIVASSLVGLGVGACGAFLLVKWRDRWVYALPYVIAAPLYLFWSAIALAFLMGFPIGLFALGALAGLYLGRRALRNGATPERLDAVTRNACVFVTGVTALGALAMGALAVCDEHTMPMLLATIGLADLAATAGRRTLIVALSVPLLTALQLVATQRMVRLAYGRRVSRPGRGVAT